jgi:hypothetical protein
MVIGLEARLEQTQGFGFCGHGCFATQQRDYNRNGCRERDKTPEPQPKSNPTPRSGVAF